MAARVHDSVLQTLALIQRRADEPQQVIQLARAQERELRVLAVRRPGARLDGRRGHDAGRRGAADPAGGRGPARDRRSRPSRSATASWTTTCAALLAAAREATVNAAKWSGADVVSLFAEVEPAEVSLFVRDRGRGFDPAAVPGDRKGLAESVHARMARRGGSATVRSAPGEGTEVSLTMPRAAGERQPSRA